MITRRGLIAGSIATGVAPARAQAAATLGEAAARAGLIFGASIGPEAFGDPAYASLYRRETRLLTTDVALKFDWLRPAPDVWNFGPADRIFAAAKAEGKLVRGHTLVWNDNAPAWLKALSTAEIRRVFDAHIDTVVARYAGRLHSWDVVNEPFWPMARQDGGWRDGPWFRAFGPSYVERAFRRVAAIDKTAKLTLNEAQCDNDHVWGRTIRPLLRRLVDDLQHRDAPVHAIGLQSHLQPQFPHDYNEFASFADGFGAGGLEVYLSEFDVNDEAFPDDIFARDKAVAAIAREFLAAALSTPAVRMVVTWQMSDKYSWYRDLWRRKHPFSSRQPRPLPFDAEGQSKPMYLAMQEEFSKRRVGARP